MDHMGQCQEKDQDLKGHMGDIGKFQEKNQDLEGRWILLSNDRRKNRIWRIHKDTMLQYLKGLNQNKNPEVEE